MTGPELRQWRERVGWTQTDLALALRRLTAGVMRTNPATVCDWEQERHPVPPLLFLALARFEADGA